MTASSDRVGAVVTGLGTCLPETVVTNDELSRHLDTDHAWIHSRTGIERRRRVSAGTTTGDLAVTAGAAALKSAGRDDCDLVLLATTTPDRRCPATAPRVASRLGLRAAAFDLSAVCSGFVYGLSVADAMITAGTCERALVIGADVYSSIVDPGDRGTAVVFGDGAGAVLLERGRTGDPGAVLHTELGSDGTGDDLITIPPDGDHLTMRGSDVYARAVTTMTESARSVAAHAGWDLADVDAFVGHQANLRILTSVAKRLGLPRERVVSNIADVANTAAASIPLALADAAAEGRVGSGDRLLLTAFGGGLTWGSAAVVWSGAEPVQDQRS
ncbi:MULTISPECIES: beta-ketoacyl-ACP synthase III [unclassified Streptomyces]|uniref:beta-ketoacyl-ACP synthase III n=1 Tax=unclassified Streptomyces TaxID=2593676 RepID=UPI00278A5262|nr:beta-ketoacyl-ACP synthase III [Streptomyces sp. DSM 40167]MDQ0404437.1 3-oxoacyl-[acyl-carrier-protein] synthase-3 [Streptomyces sp. DSM 40167]